MKKWEWRGLEEGLKNRRWDWWEVGVIVEKGAEDEGVRENEEAREVSRSAEEKEKKQ